MFGAKDDSDDESGTSASEQEDDNNTAFAVAERPVPAIVTQSGEEAETHVFSTRVKLFRLQRGSGGAEGSRWKELGVGPLRLNVPQDPESEDAKFPRVVMRREGVLKLLLNAYITPGVVLESVGDRMVQISCTSYTEDPEITGIGTFLIKLAREADRTEMLKLIDQLKRLAAAVGPASSTAAGDAAKSSSPASAKDDGDSSDDAAAKDAAWNSAKP